MFESDELNTNGHSHSSANTTLGNLDSALTTLLDPTVERLFDSDGIIGYLLWCLTRIVDDKQYQPDVKLEQVFQLLATSETVLRTRSSEETREVVGKLRIGGKTAMDNLLPSPNARSER